MNETPQENTKYAVSSGSLWGDEVLAKRERLLQTGLRRHPPRVLSDPEKHKLWKWVEDNKDRLLESRPVLLAVAEMATKELGFELPLTAPNISAAQKTTGIYWSSKNYRDRSEGLAVVRGQRTRLLARAICELYDKLNEKVDDSVRMIAQGY